MFRVTMTRPPHLGALDMLLSSSYMGRGYETTILSGVTGIGLPKVSDRSSGVEPSASLRQVEIVAAQQFALRRPQFWFTSLVVFYIKSSLVRKTAMYLEGGPNLLR